jgi:hypothetical protein
MNNQDYLIAPQNLVTFIQKNIRLENVSSQNIVAIIGIGAYERNIRGKIFWIIDYFDENELAEKLRELNILGFLFEGEPTGWPPAEVFDNLRKKNLLNERFKEVRWRGPGDWFIIER